MKTKTRTSPNQQVTAKKPVKQAAKSATKHVPKKKKKINATNLTTNKKTSINEIPNLPDLSSINIAKLLSNFMTLRSIVKNCTRTLGQVEKFMDSTWSMFNVAQTMMGQARPKRKNPFSFLLPPPKKEAKNKAQDHDDEEIPVIKFPGEDTKPNSKSKSKSKKQSPPPMLGNLMENIDMGQIFKVMQSPIFQQMLSGLLKGKPAASTSSVKDDDKE
jgi:hypothetical protein